jgi:DNA segregation ATPase FtsK/SpoIIIE, S-DNA-T family
MKKENKQKTTEKAAGNGNELLLKNEIIGIILLFISIFFIFSTVSFSPTDPSFFNSTPDRLIENYGGRTGAQFAAILFNLFGYSSYIFLFYQLFMTSFFLFNKKIQNVITKSAGYLLLLFSSCAFISNIKPYSMIDKVKVKSGGIIGYFLDAFLQSELKRFFSGLFFFVLIVIAMILIAKLSLRRIAKFLVKVSILVAEKVTAFAKEQYAKYEKWRRIKRIEEKYNTESKAWAREKEAIPAPVAHRDATQVVPSNGEVRNRAPKKRISRQPSKIPEETSLFADFDDVVPDPQKYQPPPLSYLDAATERSKIDYKELEEKKEDLGRRLNEFRIRGEIKEYTPGPVITTYEFVPDTGVKVKDVTNLSEDLALVAKAQYVRIERILGKKAIGIEIPNKKREIIHLRDVLESEDYQNSSSPLTIGIGKSKNGEIFITDLREMPHLIVAGATGSGKSVAIHTILLSILYKSSPDDVKLVLIDPKRVELALYNTLPHLLTPVVVNMKLARNALDWAVWEMEERYKKLAMLQVRSLEQFNKKLELLKQAGDNEVLDKLENTEKVPYVVIVIDEFADLMMESSKEIENSIARIAQKARAVGIHLILATQRPSTDVITGTIKNNFPSRIALAVPSKHDSRTIIDIMGAEKLLGNGDMLFLPPKTATLVRLHCAYVSEEETLRVVNFLSKMGRPKFNTQVVKPKVDEDAELAASDLDDMFYGAAEVVINTGQASASYLQRKLSIGYARAGRLIDQLQANGVVSAKDSKNKREILLTLEELNQMREI